eukprot:Lithocolla_globosa_v1_NODE_7356_length_956_cov_10.588235.p2 type:complete len:120 gc:universal NODE_7356_length_956_cov_10.588235:389-748(+)
MFRHIFHPIVQNILEGFRVGQVENKHNPLHTSVITTYNTPSASEQIIHIRSNSPPHPSLSTPSLSLSTCYHMPSSAFSITGHISTQCSILFFRKRSWPEVSHRSSRAVVPSSNCKVHVL